MIEDLLHLSQNFLTIYNRKYIRYFIKAHLLQNRFSIIVGQRGVGKTTAIIQYILRSYESDLLPLKRYTFRRIISWLPINRSMKLPSSFIIWEAS